MPNQPLIINNKKANAAILLVLSDKTTERKYTLLIHNKWDEYSCPGGKVDEEDKIDGYAETNELAITRTYINAALRELQEEAFKEEYHGVLQELLQQDLHHISQVDRNNPLLDISEADHTSDSRIFTVYLGIQEVATIQSWLKEPALPEDKTTEAKEVFLIPVIDLSYDKLSLNQDKGKNKYYLTRINHAKEQVCLPIRKSTLVALHGPEPKPNDMPQEKQIKQQLGLVSKIDCYKAEKIDDIWTKASPATVVTKFSLETDTSHETNETKNNNITSALTRP
ncbi:MAG: hypothetical protein ACK4PR_06810 [Gammaproteobacteria bacterium]